MQKYEKYVNSVIKTIQTALGLPRPKKMDVAVPANQLCGEC
jgi:hypothetical protein